MDKSKVAKLAQEPALKDLPLKVRAQFAKAIVAELEGDTGAAAAHLETAVTLELEAAATK